MDSERREPHNPAPRNITTEFLDMGESELWDFLDQLPGNAVLEVTLPVGVLASDELQLRLKRFKLGGKNQTRRVVIHATKAEHEIFKDRFPADEWEIG